MAKARKKPRRKKKPDTLGLTASEVVAKAPPPAVETLASQIEADGGVVLARYREPVGEHWQLLAALPLSKVKPTAFQRDLSDTHVKRLAEKIDRLHRFIDPITVVRSDDGQYLTPNGHHRTSAMGRLGARSILALVIPDFEIAYQILALNTEKAYNLKEKSLEAIRMARTLSQDLPRATEAEFAEQFEEPGYLVLGICYEKNKRFSGGQYNPILRRTEEFSDANISKVLNAKQKKADRLLELDAEVAKVVEKLKKKGLKSPYLKSFVVARINPLRWVFDRGQDFDKTLTKMEASLKKFDPDKIEQHHLSQMAGPVEDPEAG